MQRNKIIDLISVYDYNERNPNQNRFSAGCTSSNEDNIACIEEPFELFDIFYPNDDSDLVEHSQ